MRASACFRDCAQGGRGEGGVWPISSTKPAQVATHQLAGKHGTAQRAPSRARQPPRPQAPPYACIQAHAATHPLQCDQVRLGMLQLRSGQPLIPQHRLDSMHLLSQLLAVGLVDLGMSMVNAAAWSTHGQRCPCMPSASCAGLHAWCHHHAACAHGPAPFWRLSARSAPAS
jgi:hypothetical protein